jgi:DNA-binding NarL/FixJ family response regulator
VKLRIVVADANEGILAQIVSFLEPEFEVIATATDGKSALALIAKDGPDIAVLDLRLPGINGIEVIKRISEFDAQPFFVVCSTEDDPDFVEAASGAGAQGYVLKARIATDLIPAVRAAARGDRFVSV